MTASFGRNRIRRNTDVLAPAKKSFLGLKDNNSDTDAERTPALSPNNKQPDDWWWNALPVQEDFVKEKRKRNKRSKKPESEEISSESD